MLYMIDIDYRAGLFADQADTLIPVEHAYLRDLHERGTLRYMWRKANGQGGFFIIDAPDHDTVRDIVTKFPVFPYFTGINVLPLVCHPLFPQFGPPKP